MKLLRTLAKCAWKPVLLLATVGCLSNFWPGVAFVVANDGTPAVTCSIETDKSVLPANEQQKIVAKITLRAAQPAEN